MKKFITIIISFIGFIFVWQLSYPEISFYIYKQKYTKLVSLCENSKKDLASLDLIGKRESIETRVNLFMNAKANEFSCFDLVLLENELLANRVSKEKIQFLKLQSISQDPKLIERIDSNNQ